MHHLSRRAALTVGGAVTAVLLTAGAGVASAATSQKATSSATPTITSSPTASTKTTHRIARAEKRQTLRANHFDKVAHRLDARSVTLATQVNGLATGTSKTDALARLADLKAKTAAARTEDAKVRAAIKGIDPSNVPASLATLKADRARLKAARKDIAAARRDVAKVVQDLR